ncbi:hypothetical protein MBLL_03595 [Methylobacterium bullatum]|uniref:Transposase TnpC homeodomain domain-containing protein n=1 Tax=Methylobacterium bullatum TaxID=570505 RepID=A0A679KGB9_9HYPH|nr:hypothetical protein MBLL_03595 [Methylobacterium bullatum]
MIMAERAARLASEIAVERLKLEVARLRRERFGTSSESSARIDQLELVLEDLEETLAETNAQVAAEPEALPGAASSRRKPARRSVVSQFELLISRTRWSLTASKPLPPLRRICHHHVSAWERACLSRVILKFIRLGSGLNQHQKAMTAASATAEA